MPHKKKTKRPATGAVGLLNRNQRSQLEELGYIDKPKKAPKKRAKSKRGYKKK